MMLVSILIPAYNAERWIAESIQSALEQSCSRTEVIVVDDGSTDETLSIARRFESGSVKVVSQENRGAAAARNHAVSLAQGDYIQWLDADDLLGEGKIAAQMEVAQELADPRILLSSGFGWFYCDRGRAGFVPTPLWQDLKPADWIVTKFSNNIWMNPAVWLVSRQLTEQAGPWNEKLSLDDDGEYFCRVVANSDFVTFVPKSRIYYRQWNTGSLSRSVSQDACESLFLSLSLSIGYLLSLEDSSRTRQASLNYLQVWMQYFYPDTHGLLQPLNQLASELGGELNPPTLTWKYRLIKDALGWGAARRAKHAVSRTSLFLRYNVDSLRSSLRL